MVYDRETLALLRQFIAGNFGMTCRDFMLKYCREKVISEFNVLGAFAWFHRAYAFAFKNTESDPHPPACVRQHWSYGGVTPEIATAMTEHTT